MKKVAYIASECVPFFHQEQICLSPIHIIYAEKLKHFNIIGASTHSLEDAKIAEKLGATYITASHIFATDCKKGLEPRGLDFLKNICDNVNIPVFALGGINEDNSKYCYENGAKGVCMMSQAMKYR